jgi:hypothetical protein
MPCILSPLGHVISISIKYRAALVRYRGYSAVALPVCMLESHICTFHSSRGEGRIQTLTLIWRGLRTRILYYILLFFTVSFLDTTLVLFLLAAIYLSTLSLCPFASGSGSICLHTTPSSRLAFTMNGTPPPAILPSKATSKTPSSSGQSSPAQSQANPITSGDRGGGSFRAAGTSSSRASPTPRNNQGQRSKHKGSKRFARLTDEDVIAESVCLLFSISLFAPKY